MEDVKTNVGIHNFKLINNKIILDDFEIKGIISYSLIKNSAASPTELSIKLLVND